MFALLQATAAETAASPADTAATAAVDAATAAASAVAAAPVGLTDEQKAAAAAQAATDAGQNAITVEHMFMQADIVVKTVMIGLFLASVYSLALLFEKIIVMRSNKSKISNFVTAFRKAKTPEEAAEIAKKQPDSVVKQMFIAGQDELAKSRELGLYANRDARDHTLDRVRSAMTLKENDAVEGLSSNMTLLASIGSNAPFIGLFGTVWGIMNSFIGIANTQTTSLAVVAPGIAEALLATAIGLLAAIPAVLIYNFSAKQISSISGKLDDFQGEYQALVSRDMDSKTS
jgi:biopolymer transport protein ExbB